MFYWQNSDVYTTCDGYRYKSELKTVSHNINSFIFFLGKMWHAIFWTVGAWMSNRRYTIA